MKIYNKKTSRFEEVKSIKYYSGETKIKDVEEYQIPVSFQSGISSYLEFKPSPSIFLTSNYIHDENDISTSITIIDISFVLNTDILKNQETFKIKIEVMDKAYASIRLDGQIVKQLTVYEEGSTKLESYEIKYPTYKFPLLVTITLYAQESQSREAKAKATLSIETPGGFIPIKSIKQYQDANNLIILEDFNQ